MDFEQLVSGSEKLLSHIARPDGIPRLDKSLGEIVSSINYRQYMYFPSREFSLEAKALQSLSRP